MGYTNYWTKSSKKKFSPGIIGLVHKVLYTYEQKSGEKVVKGFFCKDQDPTVTDTRIHFNVNKEDSGEDFFIDLKEGDDEFCKTDREPYDAAIKAVLMVLKSAGYLDEWHFDGSICDDEYSDAMKLLSSAGIKYTEKMESRK
jgi:hypothetical protein